MEAPCAILCAAPPSLTDDLVSVVRELGHEPVSVTGASALDMAAGRFALGVVVDAGVLDSPFTAATVRDLVSGARERTVAERGLLFGLMPTRSGIAHAHAHRALWYAELDLHRGTLTRDGRERVRTAIRQTLELPPGEPVDPQADLPAQHLRGVLDGSRAPLIVLDDHSHVRFANLAAQALWKCPCALLADVPLSRLCASARGAADLQELIERSTDSGGGETEARLRAADGTEIDALVAWSPVSDPPESRSVCLTVHDLSRFRPAECPARRHRLGLLRLARLGLAGEQVSDVAHQLSQPLFAIMAHVTSARTRLEAQAGAGRALADLECIESAAGKAADIVDRLKKLMVEADLQPSSVHPEEPVRFALQLLRDRIRRARVDVRVDAGRDTPAMRADAARIRQALSSVMKNAVEAMARCEAEPRELTVRIAPLPEDAVRIDVADTGPGSPTQDVERLFEPFFTTRPELPGLGLWFARAIVEGGGGRLEALPRTPRGLTVRFTLPIRAAPAGHEAHSDGG